MSSHTDDSNLRGRTLSPSAMSVFSVVVLATFQTAGSAPTPLYRLYQEEWSLSPLMLTLVFAVYPLSILVSLLTVGPLSDYVGRRPVIVGALALSAASMVMFAMANAASWLIAARIIQGLATGSAATALGAAILDVKPESGALVNSVTSFVGTTIGALGASVLVTYAPAPAQLVYVVLLAAFLLQVIALQWMPETTKVRPGAWASLRPDVSVPPQARRAFLMVSPVNVAGWALGGFYLSLMPSLLRVATGFVSPFVGGIVVAALTLTGAAAIYLCRRWTARRILVTGASSLAAGVSVTLFGVAIASATILILGTIVAGFGFGASFFGAARTILPLAAPDERAGLLSAFYVESYLAFSLPAIAVGLLAPRLGLLLSTHLYGGLVIVAALASLGATLVEGRKDRYLTSPR